MRRCVIDLDSLGLFVFGTGIGEGKNSNFCLAIEGEENKLALLRFVQSLLVESSTSKSRRQPEMGGITGGQQPRLL